MKNKKEIKNILVITLSNIGDVVLTLPVIDMLGVNFSDTQLSIMVSGQVKELFENNPRIKEVILYNKKVSLWEKLKLISHLRKKRYDLVLDLRNTLFPYLIGTPHHTSIFCRVPASVSHMRDRHLWKLRSTVFSFTPDESIASYPSTWIKPEDNFYVSQFLRKKGVKDSDRIVAVNPGARSHIKRWKKEGFRYVCEKLIFTRAIKVVIIGEREDFSLAKEIVSGLKNEPIIACGQTTLTQLFSLISKCSLLISNDTAPMHIASYLKVPVVAIFGPTDPDKYRPQGKGDIVIRKELSCSPCERAICQFNNECMQLILPEEVFVAADKLLKDDCPHL